MDIKKVMANYPGYKTISSGPLEHKNVKDLLDNLKNFNKESKRATIALEGKKSRKFAQKKPINKISDGTMISTNDTKPYDKVLSDELVQASMLKSMQKNY